jgi:hypothetical protein
MIRHRTSIAKRMVQEARFTLLVGHTGPTKWLEEFQEDGWLMAEPKDRLARERAEIAARVGRFRATQEKFQRERQTTLENAIKGARRSLWP